MFSLVPPFLIKFRLTSHTQGSKHAKQFPAIPSPRVFTDSHASGRISPSLLSVGECTDFSQSTWWEVGNSALVAMRGLPSKHITSFPSQFSLVRLPFWFNLFVPKSNNSSPGIYIFIWPWYNRTLQRVNFAFLFKADHVMLSGEFYFCHFIIYVYIYTCSESIATWSVMAKQNAQGGEIYSHTTAVLTKHSTSILLTGAGL